MRFGLICLEKSVARIALRCSLLPQYSQVAQINTLLTKCAKMQFGVVGSSVSVAEHESPIRQDLSRTVFNYGATVRLGLSVSKASYKGAVDPNC